MKTFNQPKHSTDIVDKLLFRIAIDENDEEKEEPNSQCRKSANGIFQPN